MLPGLLAVCRACVERSLSMISKSNKAAKATLKELGASLSLTLEGSGCPPPTLLKVSRVRGTKKERNS